MFFNQQTLEIYKPLRVTDPNPNDPWQEQRDPASEKRIELDGTIFGTLSAIAVHPGQKNSQQFQDATYILRCHINQIGFCSVGYYLLAASGRYYQCVGTLSFTNVLPSYAVYLKDPQQDVESMVVESGS